MRPKDILANVILWPGLIVLMAGLVVLLGVSAEQYLEIPNTAARVANEASAHYQLDYFSPLGLQHGRATMQALFVIGTMVLFVPLLLAGPFEPGGELDTMNRFLLEIQKFLFVSTLLAYLPFPLAAMIVIRLSVSWGMFRWLKHLKLLPDWLRWRHLVSPAMFGAALAGSRGPLVTAFFGLEYLAIGYALQGYPAVGCILLALGGMFLTSFSIQGLRTMWSARKPIHNFLGWAVLNVAFTLVPLAVAGMLYYSLFRPIPAV